MRLFSLSAVVAAMFVFCDGLSQAQDFDGVSFIKADSLGQLYPNHSLYEIPALAQKLTSSLSTDAEKFRAIYRWVCSNVANDYFLYRDNQLKRQKWRDPDAIKAWNKVFAPLVMETLLKKHRTVCTGYAYLVRELALYAGLSCVTIDGYGRTAQSAAFDAGVPNHSWNAVRLDNRWYLCDATWSAGAMDLDRKEFIGQYNDAYFLAEPVLFIRTHFPLDSSWSLMQNKVSLQEFLSGPLFYSEAFNLNVTEPEPKSFAINADVGRRVLFRFKTKASRKIQKIELQAIMHGSSRLTEPKFSQTDDGKVSFEYAFDRKGLQALHILTDGKYVVSYTADVK